MKFDDDRLIYLDLEFISRKYEAHFGQDPATKITKQEGCTAGLKALFATAGISTQESRTYSVTSRQMLHNLWAHLIETYPLFENFQNYQGTKLVWMQGELTLAEWTPSGSKRKGFEFFQLNNGVQRTAFLADKSYFSAGFAEVFDASMALKGNIGIPVYCLARVMWNVEAAMNYVACPYIITERIESHE